ncbi:hypothetical protein DL98DRAFT_588170 [Cadophora sp. DSE1049]|nr:hypothetical protein DL98DRAFT_588170 [Cadophora sp. DSE1049]
MPGQGVVRAIDLAIYLGESSWSTSDDLGPLCGWSAEEYQVERLLDPILDEVLLDLVKQAREEDTTIELESQKATLKRSIDYLARYDINTYFPKSYELLCS